VAIDLQSDTGLVRAVISDMDEANLILSDEVIGAYLELEGSNVKLAAARALDAIATSESLLGKMIRTQDLTTNGPAVAADLRRHAAQLRADVANEVAAAEGFYLGVVEFGSPLGAEGTERYW
jgi:hypothetical protein